MRGGLKTISAAVLPLVLALVLSACGGAASSSITIAFRSPALQGSSLPALYTCDGKDISPPMEWGAVPSTSRELAVFVLGLTPAPSAHAYRTSIAWAVAGVDPRLHRLAAGTLPPGAHVALEASGKAGLREQRYSICPPRGRTERYQFALYSVPAGLTVPPRFVGTRLLEAIANPESPNQANAGGAFLATYKRT